MQKADKPIRHLVIPDTQTKPGAPTDHLSWVGQAIVKYKPDVVVHMGDHWDFPSLNQHDKPGSKMLENARYQDDVDAGNKAFAQLCTPMDKEIARLAKTKTPWKPQKHFIMGNHEQRADRAADSDPKWLGHVGSQHCNVRDFKWHGFLKRVWLNGICYSHYFQSSHSKFPVGGEVSNRLNKVGCSFVQGHEQGFRYGNKILASGRTIHGLVAGSAYLHEEAYRGAQGQRHWRGIVVLNGVINGDYCVMPLTLDYLCREFEGMGLQTYMEKKYKGVSWDHLSMG